MLYLMEHKGIVGVRLDDLDGPSACRDDGLKFLVRAHAHPVDGICLCGTCGIYRHSVRYRVVEMGKCRRHYRRAECFPVKVQTGRRDPGIKISRLKKQ